MTTLKLTLIALVLLTGCAMAQTKLKEGYCVCQGTTSECMHNGNIVAYPNTCQQMTPPRKPNIAKRIIRGMYCDERKPDGSCKHWAKHPYPCTYNDQTGGCTNETK